MSKGNTAAFVMMLLTIATISVHAGFDDSLNYDTLPCGRNDPDRVQCRASACSTCRHKVLVCPKECPHRGTVAPGKSACFADCSPKCQATCKHRKPNCWSYGAVCYDPRFVGGDGIMFYFHGKANNDFCLVSDINLHINAHFIGKRPEGRTRDYTWVQALGLLYDSHQFTVASNQVAKWDDAVDQIAFSYDGQPIELEAKSLATWVSPSGEMKVERVGDTNSVEIVVDQKVALIVTVKPITEEENRVHNYQIPEDDCFAHLNLQFKFYNLSSTVDGVLGQTYRPDFQNPVKVGVPMPIMGGDDKFFSSSLLSADCKSSRFSSSTQDIIYSQEAASTKGSVFSVNCNSRKGGSGIVCRR